MHDFPKRWLKIRSDSVARRVVETKCARTEQADRPNVDKPPRCIDEPGMIVNSEVVLQLVKVERCESAKAPIAVHGVRGHRSKRRNKKRLTTACACKM